MTPKRVGRAEESTHSEAATALAVLGSETRLRILRELWEASDAPVGFSELRARVGVRDPGQFAYHLNRLVGPYVEKSDAGYSIRMAGVNVVWAMLSGEVTGHPPVERFEAEGECDVCGGSLEAEYEDELLSVECVDCGHVLSIAPFPPSGVVDRTPEAVLNAYDRRFRSYIEQVVNDVCPRCASSGTVSVVDEDDELPGGADEVATASDDVVVVHFRCTRCGFWAVNDLLQQLTHHSAVERFYRDCGVDFDALPIWLRAGHVRGEAEVRSERPLSFAVRYVEGDAVLELAVDETLSILDAERSERA